MGVIGTIGDSYVGDQLLILVKTEQVHVQVRECPNVQKRADFLCIFHKNYLTSLAEEGVHVWIII